MESQTNEAELELHSDLAFTKDNFRIGEPLVGGALMRELWVSSSTFAVVQYNRHLNSGQRMRLSNVF